MSHPAATSLPNPNEAQKQPPVSHPSHLQACDSLACADLELLVLIKTLLGGPTGTHNSRMQASGHKQS